MCSIRLSTVNANFAFTVDPSKSLHYTYKVDDSDSRPPPPPTVNLYNYYSLPSYVSKCCFVFSHSAMTIDTPTCNENSYIPKSPTTTVVLQFKFHRVWILLDNVHATSTNMPIYRHPPHSGKQWLEQYHQQQHDNHSQENNDQSSDKYPSYLTSSQSDSHITRCCGTSLWLLTHWLSFWRTNGCGDWRSRYKWAVWRSKGVE